MLDAAAGGLDQLPRMRQEQRRIGTRPARVGGREMAADVARAERAEQRVGDRMQADVGIRMADQAAAARAAARRASTRPSPGARRWTSKPSPVRVHEAGAEQARGAGEVVLGA